MEQRRRRPPRERRLKADKMLRWSILSESPSSCAAKACVAWGDERERRADVATLRFAREPQKKKHRPYTGEENEKTWIWIDEIAL